MIKNKKYPVIIFRPAQSSAQSIRTILSKIFFNRMPHTIDEEAMFVCAYIQWKFHELSPKKAWLQVKKFIDKDLKEEEFPYDLATLILIADIEGIGSDKRDYVSKKLLALDVNLPSWILEDIMLFASDPKIRITASNILAARNKKLPVMAK